MWSSNSGLMTDINGAPFNKWTRMTSPRRLDLLPRENGSAILHCLAAATRSHNTSWGIGRPLRIFPLGNVRKALNPKRVATRLFFNARSHVSHPAALTCSARRSWRYATATPQSRDQILQLRQPVRRHAQERLLASRHRASPASLPRTRQEARRCAPETEDPSCQTARGGSSSR